MFFRRPMRRIELMAGKDSNWAQWISRKHYVFRKLSLYLFGLVWTMWYLLIVSCTLEEQICTTKHYIEFLSPFHKKAFFSQTNPIGHLLRNSHLLLRSVRQQTIPLLMVLFLLPNVCNTPTLKPGGRHPKTLVYLLNSFQAYSPHLRRSDLSSNDQLASTQWHQCKKKRTNSGGHAKSMTRLISGTMWNPFHVKFETMRQWLARTQISHKLTHVKPLCSCWFSPSQR